MAEVSACPADVWNQFPAAAMFSHSNLVVREISSNKTLQALLLSESADGQRTLFSASPCTCKSKGPGTVPLSPGVRRAWRPGLEHHPGGYAAYNDHQTQTLLSFETKPQAEAEVLCPSCRRLPGVAPKSHVPSVHLVSLTAKQEIFFLHLHCWRVCQAGLCPPVCTALIQWSHNPRCCYHKNRNWEQCFPSKQGFSCIWLFKILCLKSVRRANQWLKSKAQFTSYLVIIWGSSCGFFYLNLSAMFCDFSSKSLSSEVRCDPY